MTRARVSIFAVLLLAALPSLGQIQSIEIPAGTPEDKDLTAITNELDNQKKVAMYQEFLQKYASNAMAVAYGSWQLSQIYQSTGDLQKALEYADKAGTSAPRNLDIAVSQVTIAEQLKDNASIFKYSIRGGEIYDSIEKQSKPADVSNEQFASDVANQKDQNKNSYDFFKTAAFNAIAAETSAKARMDDIDQFMATFPHSGLDDQISSFAMLSLSELKDNKRLIAFAENRLTQKPDDLPSLVMLANAYADSEPSKAIPYAEKAVLAAKADAPDADRARKISAGSAHYVIGRIYANQGKTLPSITELKSATTLLKGQDEQQFALAAYYLGWDYAKLNRLTEARAILSEMVSVPGPVQGLARDLLTKVNTARAAGK